MSNLPAPQFGRALTDAEEARCRWLAASDRAGVLAADMYRPGTGYGCPEAEQEDKHQLETARAEAERFFREYQDLERRDTQRQMQRLQRSQQLATWASFCVAAAVGLATIASIVMRAGK